MRSRPDHYRTWAGTQVVQWRTHANRWGSRAHKRCAKHRTLRTWRERLHAPYYRFRQHRDWMQTVSGMRRGQLLGRRATTKAQSRLRYEPAEWEWLLW